MRDREGKAVGPAELTTGPAFELWPRVAHPIARACGMRGEPPASVPRLSGSAGVAGGAAESPGPQEGPEVEK